MFYYIIGNQLLKIVTYISKDKTYKACLEFCPAYIILIIFIILKIPKMFLKQVKSSASCSALLPAAGLGKGGTYEYLQQDEGQKPGEELLPLFTVAAGSRSLLI